MKYAYSNFEANLRDTVAAARASGARVIVSTVATNLKDCAPFASIHRGGLPLEELQSWTALVQQGVNLEAARSYADALKTYQAVAKIDDQYAELEFRKARNLWMLGDYEVAREQFQRSRDLCVGVDSHAISFPDLGGLLSIRCDWVRFFSHRLVSFNPVYS